MGTYRKWHILKVNHAKWLRPGTLAVTVMVTLLMRTLNWKNRTFWIQGMVVLIQRFTKVIIDKVLRSITARFHYNMHGSYGVNLINLFKAVLVCLDDSSQVATTDNNIIIIIIIIIINNNNNNNTTKDISSLGGGGKRANLVIWQNILEELTHKVLQNWVRQYGTNRRKLCSISYNNVETTITAILSLTLTYLMLQSTTQMVVLKCLGRKCINY